MTADKSKTVYEKDLDELLGRAEVLQDLYIKYVKEESRETMGKLWAEFKVRYQSWYSESLALIKVVMPDRLNDFRRQYEKSDKRRNITDENYLIEDALASLRTYQYHQGNDECEPKTALSKFQIQLSILAAVKQVFQSSLFNIKEMLQADLFDDDVQAAIELNKNGFGRAAGAMCGVVLEKHLSEVCVKHVIKIAKKDPCISDFNDALKAAGVYPVPSFRRIQYMADIRNKCGHKKSTEPTKGEVETLIEGVDWAIKNIF